MQYPYENLENFTLPAVLERSLLRYESKSALGKVGQNAMTYAQMGEDIARMRHLLLEHGIHKGDKVVILSENMPNWGIAYLSITTIGAVAVPILPDFHPSDVHHILRHSEAKAVFVSNKYLQTIEECERSNIEFAVELEKLELVKGFREASYLEQLKAKVKERFQKQPIIIPVVEEDDLCAIIYTSGTTGHSKGVMLTHKNIVTNAMSSCSVIEIVPEDVFLSILPLAHTFECTVGLIVPILHGSSVYYVDKTPTPTVLLKAFEIVRPTMMLSVPLIIEKIYKNRVLSKINDSAITRNLYKMPFFRKKLNKIAGKKLIQTFGGRIRFFGVGGAALSPFVEEFLLEAEFPYVVGYGLTETAPLLAGTPINAKRRFKSTGPAMFGVKFLIKDKDPQTGMGEICAKSPSVMLGYYKDDVKTKEVFDADGWFLTGDLGYLDKDGYLFISGRSKNVIISASGENIYPEQIESVINQNEFVLDALVLEQEGKLVARIHLDYELLDKHFAADQNPDGKVKEEIDKLLEEMRLEVNGEVAAYCRMTKFIEQIEPFVKTPTKKIKRYLYTN